MDQAHSERCYSVPLRFTQFYFGPREEIGQKKRYSRFMAIYKKVRTPCIGVCSTGIGDNVCRGCKRFAHEVIDWNAYTEEQRRIIAERRDGYLANAVRSQLEIVDKNRLLTQMRHQQIRFNEDQNPYCWVFELLRAGASQIEDPADYGLRSTPVARGASLVELRRRIDEDFYALSMAYYQRFVAPGLTGEVG